MSILSGRIREERQWMGFAPSWVAQALAVSVGAYDEIEAGTVEPTGEQLALLARLFGTTTERLQGEPLRADPAIRIPDGLTPEDAYHVHRFAELLRHYDPAPSKDPT